MTKLKLTLNFESLKMLIEKTFSVEELLNSPPSSPSHLSSSTKPYTREHPQTSGTSVPNFRFFKKNGTYI